MGGSPVKLQLTHLDPMDDTFHLVLFITPPRTSELCGAKQDTSLTLSKFLGGF
jgi:hypothetical protein